MKRLSGKRARYCAIGTDQPQIEAELPGDWQGESMPSSSHQHDFDTRGMRSPQGLQIAIRNLKLRIEQRAVDIGRQQPDGRVGNLHYVNFIIA
jgi:hypothetical protein